MTAPMQPRVLGRYLFYAPIASGGMATVYLGRMAGPKGFSRIIAIKQLHAQFATDGDFVTMFIDEAHLIGRIHHANVVAPIDVLEADGELCIVMEYVHGEALGRLMRLARQERIPLRVVTAILVQTLLGLHAAHEVTDSDGQPLSIVHRDVSPQNILVGEDGISRVVDFGIAKVAYRASQSDTTKLKGKLGYMAPEQFTGGELDRRCDIFSAGIILWEMLTGKRLFAGATSLDEATERMRQFEPRPPSSITPSLSTELDAITLKALSVDPSGRFANAHDMARALEAACPPAGAIEVAEWVTRLVGDTLSERAGWISELVALDLSEWTQSYTMSSSPPPAVEPTEPMGLPPVWRRASKGFLTDYLKPVATVLLVAAVAGLGFVFWPRAPRPSSRTETVVYAASPPDDGNASSLASAVPTIAVRAPIASLEPTVSANAPSASALKLDATVSANAPSASALKLDAAVPGESTATVRPTHHGTRPNCAVPYVIDAKRIKRFRPECFK